MFLKVLFKKCFFLRKIYIFFICIFCEKVGEVREESKLLLYISILIIFGKEIMLLL